MLAGLIVPDIIIISPNTIQNSIVYKFKYTKIKKCMEKFKNFDFANQENGASVEHAPSDYQEFR